MDDENRTKIVCTIGPASSATRTIRDMIIAGMDVARINFSHGDGDANVELLHHVQGAAKELEKPVAIMQDLQGPKIRVGQIPGEGLDLLEGKIATLQAGTAIAEHGVIPVPYERFAHDLRRGDRILIADGTRELEVVEVKGKTVKARVMLGGRIISFKGINVPTATLSVDSMTEKDEADLALGLAQSIDFVALSFVRSKEDVAVLRKKIEQYLPSGIEPPGIIVKIEKHEALEKFDEILEAADGVMIARGDLGLETPVTQVPIRQKELIAKCVVAGKPVITATEMLGSMEHNPRPTRAEVSDVANAVIDHTDATMLSGETATGRYPVLAVKTMAEIIRHTEETPLDNLHPHIGTIVQNIPAAVAATAVELSRRVGARAILVATRSGYSARMAARYRPEIPLYAVTPSVRTRNQLVLSWGVDTILAEAIEEPERLATAGLKNLKGKIVVVSGLRREKDEQYDSAIRVVEL